MNKLLICTVCVHSDKKPIERLENSCKHLKLDFHDYGFGDKWKGYVHHKVVRLIEELERVNHKYVLFSDGFDSWMLQDEKTILKKFKKFNSPVVISSSFTPRIKFHDIDYSGPDARSFKYINAGQFMGERKGLIKRLKILRDRAFGETSDNLLWDYAHHYGWFDFKIDLNCELFLAMCTVPIKKVYFKKNRIYSAITKTYPASIHFNGPRGGHPNGLNFDRMYKLYLNTI